MQGQRKDLRSQEASLIGYNDIPQGLTKPPTAPRGKDCKLYNLPIDYV